MAKWQPPKYAEIARLEEESVHMTGPGIFSAILLTLHNFLMLVLFVGAARSAVQETSLGTIWIAGNVLFGACMLAGRRRTYRVLREQPPTEPQM